MAKRCKALAKSTRERCRQSVVPGKEVCHYHGGKTPGGIASPHYKTGRYSKYLPSRMRARYEESRADPELLEMRSEIGLTDARLSELLSRVDSGESGAVWDQLFMLTERAEKERRDGNTKGLAVTLNVLFGVINGGVGDWNTWSDIFKLVEQRRRLVESERKRLVEMQQTVQVERVMVLVDQLALSVREHVLANCDTDVSRLILAGVQTDIARVVGSPTD